MPLPSSLEQFRATFDPALESFFDQAPEWIALPTFAVAPVMLDHLRELTLRGGKRVRPALFEMVSLGLAGERAGSTRDRQLVGVACELMQTSLLILDDIMDEAALRRGKQTLHHAYARHASHAPERYGESMATLAGVAAGYLGVEVLRRTSYADAAKLEAIGLYSQVMMHEAFGQGLDITLTEQKEQTELEILEMYRYKTARYTTEMPLEFAGILTGQPEPVRQHLGRLGQSLGIAFQIQDDIIGVFGEERAIGKSSLSDIAEGKRTLLYHKAMEILNGRERKIFLDLYGKADLSAAEGLVVGELLEMAGAKAYASRLAESYIAEGKRLIEGLPLSATAREELHGVAAYLVGRGE